MHAKLKPQLIVRQIKAYHTSDRPLSGDTRKLLARVARFHRTYYRTRRK